MKTIKIMFAALLLITTAISTKAQQPAVGPINNVLTAYLDLKNALVADNATAAQDKAKVLYEQVAGVKVKELPAKQQSTWKGLADKLSFDSRHISETNPIAHKREHFASLSKNMYTLLKASPVNGKIIYVQYCPMKKASWLSDKTSIENPYYGKEMLDCGAVKEILKTTK